MKCDNCKNYSDDLYLCEWIKLFNIKWLCYACKEKFK